MTSDGGGSVIKVDELPSGENASTFDGHQHGAQVSFFLSHNRPGTGPKLHRHPYEETFIVEDGDVLFTVGGSTIEARTGDIVIVPAGAPHKFVIRAATHRQVSIHPVARMKKQHSVARHCVGDVGVRWRYPRPRRSRNGDESRKQGGPLRRDNG